MSSVRIFHNPRCSKSRQALALLEERGAEPEIVLYLKSPPSRDELAALHTMLGVPVIDMVRTKEVEFKQAGLSLESSDDELLDALVATPKLLERPVVVANGRAVIARPPEDALSVLE